MGNICPRRKIPNECVVCLEECKNNSFLFIECCSGDKLCANCFFTVDKNDEYEIVEDYILCDVKCPLCRNNLILQEPQNKYLRLKNLKQYNKSEEEKNCEKDKVENSNIDKLFDIPETKNIINEETKEEEKNCEKDKVENSNIDKLFDIPETKNIINEETKEEEKKE